MKSAKRLLLALVSVAVSLVSTSAMAGTGVSITASGSAVQIYFKDTIQQSTAQMVGGSAVNTSLELGLPAEFFSHQVQFKVGANDGVWPGPTETHALTTTYKITVGSDVKTVSVTQDVTISQISNNQFQVDIAPSRPAIVRLASGSFLQVTAYPALLQLAAGNSAGQFLQTRFLLMSTATQ